ncbi:hypothetical protein CDO73_09170 [Saccharibacillus sp. O23]|uniref:hypothetical protein n=1 Tax=Saccharibacillus sp. O23 TaxID=2009338 RepID=UPI000B4E037A|nr:hypothetical protein [Saccharibacillus sp. O23]OWR30752.1 hypothetical protein CDO73_09170 [Saccharibacillus sp. O23]
MGHRANLVIVREGNYELYYNHWCAITMPEDLFWGEHEGLRFIEMQKRVGPQEWLDDVWAEGGALMDLDRRRLLLFGGENIKYDILLQRLYLKLTAFTWPGWDVQWAYEGIAELANAAGYPGERLRERQTGKRSVPAIEPLDNPEWATVAISVRHADGTLRIYASDTFTESFLEGGPEPLLHADPALAYSELDWNTLTDSFPTAGLHLDEVERRMEFWRANPDTFFEPEPVWSGWEVSDLRDGYERQLELTEGRLLLPQPDREALLEQLKRSLLREVGSGSDTVLEVLRVHAEQGKEVQINPAVFDEERPAFDGADRERVLNEAIRRLKEAEPESLS